MIPEVLYQQRKVLGDFLNEISAEEEEDLWGKDSDVIRLQNEQNWEETEQAMILIQKYIDQAKKIDRDAGKIEQLIQHKLNLRRTAQSIRDTAESIKEARHHAKALSLSVFGFTIITFIFTPFFFIATLFSDRHRLF